MKNSGRARYAYVLGAEEGGRCIFAKGFPVVDASLQMSDEPNKSAVRRIAVDSPDGFLSVSEEEGDAGSRARVFACVFSLRFSFRPAHSARVWSVCGRSTRRNGAKCRSVRRWFSRLRSVWRSFWCFRFPWCGEWPSASVRRCALCPWCGRFCRRVPLWRQPVSERHGRSGSRSADRPRRCARSRP